MLKYIWRSAQGGAFAIAIMVLHGSASEAALAFMIGVSFEPSHFWWFL